MRLSEEPAPVNDTVKLSPFLGEPATSISKLNDFWTPLASLIGLPEASIIGTSSFRVLLCPGMKVPVPILLPLASKAS
ncbi:hypothetical protein D3C79_1053790 [compost metagenome]